MSGGTADNTLLSNDNLGYPNYKKIHAEIQSISFETLYRQFGNDTENKSKRLGEIKRPYHKLSHVPHELHSYHTMISRNLRQL